MLGLEVTKAITGVPTIRCSLSRGDEGEEQTRKLGKFFDILLLGTKLDYIAQLLLQLNGSCGWVLVNGIWVEVTHSTSRPSHKTSCAILHSLSFPIHWLNGEDSKKPEEGRTTRWKEPGFPSPYLEESCLTGTPMLDIPGAESTIFIVKANKSLEALITVIGMSWLI